MKKADELAIHQHVRPKYRELEGCFVNDSQSWKGRSNMKKQMTLMLVLLLVLTACFSNSAFALNYTGNLGNASTFETMTEVRANAPAAMQPYLSNGTYVSHPVMADYPGDTTYVYRSADMYGRNAAVRINTNLVVYSDESFATKDDALTYLKDLGLIDIIEEARGSVILVTPSDPEQGFTAMDQKHYYALQTALFSINESGIQDGEQVTYVDAAYYGGYGYLYVIGLGQGATFLNNYVASTFDYVSRIAGMLLIGGNMERIREVADIVPVYLVNAPESVIAKYEEANETDAILIEGNKKTAYNQAYPVRKVVSMNIAEPDAKAIIQDAYYNLFIKAMRGQEMERGLFTASTPYQGYGADSAPYSLDPRNALINGVTMDGIYEFVRIDDRFSDIKTEAGEYLQTWYEYLPEEIVNGTAKEGTIPLILALHGGGDDPRQYVDGQGFLELAGKERLAIVAPEKGSLHTTATNGQSVLSQVLPQLVKYMLETYPALDASRVYVTGYSMGCMASFEAIFGAPELFAAAYPQAGIAGVAPTEEQVAKFANVNVPLIISTSEYDSPKNVDPDTKNIVEEFYNLLSTCKLLNDLEPLPAADFEKYPTSGFAADGYKESKLGAYTMHTWYFTDDQGVPMVGLTFIDDIVHCLYPQYANMVWNFLKHYSRDLTTGEIVYNPYVR